MLNEKIRKYGIKIGDFKTGKNNSISDVEGVRVGNITLDKDNIKTGVTANIIKYYENNEIREIKIINFK